MSSNSPNHWLSFLELIRRVEIEKVIALMEPKSAVLEIGAGTGWQAKYMTEHGFRVIAIDVANSNYSSVGTWPVIIYDGKNIPLPDRAVDVVFSSNVLEHVSGVEAFQSEIQRVLKPDGRAIHLMPTSSWRFWTSLTMYPQALKTLYWILRSRLRSHVKIAERIDKSDGPHAVESTSSRRGWRRYLHFLRNNFVPTRHGEVGNALTELYYFSRYRWTGLFRSSGWQVERTLPNHLFYTGYFLLGSRLSIKWRQTMSYLLGSACIIYVLRTTEQT